MMITSQVCFQLARCCSNSGWLTVQVLHSTPSCSPLFELCSFHFCSHPCFCQGSMPHFITLLLRVCFVPSGSCDLFGPRWIWHVSSWGRWMLLSLQINSVHLGKLCLATCHKHRAGLDACPATVSGKVRLRDALPARSTRLCRRNKGSSNFVRDSSAQCLDAALVRGYDVHLDA